MKGMELPVNTLVIVLIAIIVLIALIALFMMSWGGGSSTITISIAKNSGCAKYVDLGYCEGAGEDGSDISIDPVKCPDSDTEAITLLELIDKGCFKDTDAYQLCCR